MVLVSCRRAPASVSLLFILSIGLFRAIVSPAQADPDQAPQPADTSSDLVVTAFRSEQALARAGSSITVITADDIQKAGAKSLTDVLRPVPGLDIHVDEAAHRVLRTSSKVISERMLPSSKTATRRLSLRPLDRPESAGLLDERQPPRLAALAVVGRGVLEDFMLAPPTVASEHLNANFCVSRLSFWRLAPPMPNEMFEAE